MFSYLASLAAYVAVVSASPTGITADYSGTCAQIGKAISTASLLSYPGSSTYNADVFHWSPSSSEVAACSVEPASAQDVSKIVKVLAGTNTPFAIKSGGHTGNAGVSSTTGVQIALTRLNTIKFNKANMTVEVAPGNKWGPVYAYLDQFNVNVAGGRVPDVGVGGFLLGGGYSWITARRGLGMNTVVGYELVLPSGDIINVSATSYPDLFFGLKGGYNNFGIVTKFTLQAFPQPQIWAGTAVFTGSAIPRAVKALVAFSGANTDVDATATGAYGVAPSGNTTRGALPGTTLFAMDLYYNGPTPPAKVAALFNAITSIPGGTIDVKTRSFQDFQVSLDSPSNIINNIANNRGELASVPVSAVTQTVTDQIMSQVDYYGSNGRGSFGNDTIVICAIETFIQTNIMNSNLSNSAYPHNKPNNPFQFYFAWTKPSQDAAAHAGIRAATAFMNSKMAGDGLDPSLMQYPNYATSDTPIAQLYGPNVPALKTLRKKYDPNGVFLRTGGYKFI